MWMPRFRHHLIVCAYEVAPPSLLLGNAKRQWSLCGIAWLKMDGGQSMKARSSWTQAWCAGLGWPECGITLAGEREKVPRKLSKACQEYIQSCSDFPPHSRILMPAFYMAQDSCCQGGTLRGGCKKTRCCSGSPRVVISTLCLLCAARASDMG